MPNHLYGFLGENFLTITDNLLIDLMSLVIQSIFIKIF